MELNDGKLSDGNNLSTVMVNCQCICTRLIAMYTNYCESHRNNHLIYFMLSHHSKEWSTSVYPYIQISIPTMTTYTYIIMTACLPVSTKKWFGKAEAR